MSIPMSQRRSGGIGNTIATVQQSIDNGLFADSPALQQTLQSRNTLPFTSSRTTSGLLSSPPSALLSGSSTSPVSAILSRQRTQTPFVRGSGLTSGLSPEQVTTVTFDTEPFNEFPVTSSFVPRTNSTLKTLFPVSKTADKLQTTISRIPRWTYVLVAIVLLAALWMFLWRHMLVQFTFGRRKGQKANCNGKRGTTGIFQFGGAKELEHEPDWKMVLGSGVPTFIPHKQDAVVQVGVHAAVQSGMAEAATMPTVVTTPVVGTVASEGVVVNGNEAVSVVSTPKNNTVSLLETIGIHRYE